FEGMRIINDDQFTDFVSFVYFIYRKIESKIKYRGYQNIIQELDTDQNSFVDISTYLTEAKEIFDSKDKNDLVNIYSVLKKLYFSYINYLKDPANNEHGVNEKDFLLIEIGEMKSWTN